VTHNNFNNEDDDDSGEIDIADERMQRARRINRKQRAKQNAEDRDRVGKARNFRLDYLADALEQDDEEDIEYYLGKR